MAGKKPEQLKEFVDSVNKKDNPHNGLKIKNDSVSKKRKSLHSKAGR
jgi:hypothetical protein